MSDLPPPRPGWYADPDGRPGLLRYWDGAAWSAQTAPAPQDAPPEAPAPASEDRTVAPHWPQQEPGWTPPPPPAPTPPPGATAMRGASPGGPGGPSSPARPSSWTMPGPEPRRRTGLVVGAVAGVLVLALVAVGLVVWWPDGDDEVSDLGPTTTPTPSATSSATPRTYPCSSGEPEDREQHADRPDRMYGGGLTMPTPAGFRRYTPVQYDFASDVQAVAERLPGNFVGTVVLGRLDRVNQYTELEQSAERVFECIVGSSSFYPDGGVDAETSSEATEVAGLDAWAYRGSMRLRGAEIEGGDLLIVIVDTEAEDSFGMYVAISTLGDEADAARSRALLETIEAE